jgi:hypothetical protein
VAGLEAAFGSECVPGMPTAYDHRAPRRGPQVDKAHNSRTFRHRHIAGPVAPPVRHPGRRVNREGNALSFADLDTFRASPSRTPEVGWRATLDASRNAPRAPVKALAPVAGSLQSRHRTAHAASLQKQKGQERGLGREDVAHFEGYRGRTGIEGVWLVEPSVGTAGPPGATPAIPSIPCRVTRALSAIWISAAAASRLICYPAYALA